MVLSPRLQPKESRQPLIGTASNALVAALLGFDKQCDKFPLGGVDAFGKDVLVSSPCLIGALRR